MTKAQRVGVERTPGGRADRQPTVPSLPGTGLESLHDTRDTVAPERVNDCCLLCLRTLVQTQVLLLASLWKDSFS